MATLANGSGLWSKMVARLAHLMQGGHGVSAEVSDIRQDLAATFKPLAGITVDEWTDPAAAVANSLKTSVASNIAAQTYTGAALNGAIGAAAFDYARNVTVTASDNSGAGGYTGSVTFKGLDKKGKAQTETVAIANNATAVGLKGFSKITEIDVPVQPDGTGAFTFGTGSRLALSHTPKARNGATTSLPPFREYMDHTTPTAGVIDCTNEMFLPNTAPNGAHDYAVYYELDGTSIGDA